MTDMENRALYIAEQCRRAGMTMAGAAGVLANIAAESAFKSTNLQDSYERPIGMNDEQYTAAVDSGSYRNFAGDDAGYGLCQWTASERKAQMLSYFSQRGRSIGDFKTQVDWMIHEMQQRNRGVFNLCCTGSNPYECGSQICLYYETPANTEAAAEYRGGKAQSWYDWLVAHAGEESEIPEEDSAEGGERDEDGIVIEKTWPPRTLQRGRCSGWAEVKLLQALLRCHGYNVVTDGIFGETLEEKTRQFQAAAGLKADGIAGPLTWKRIMQM